MAPGSEHRSPIRTDYIAKNSTQGFVNEFLMGLSDSGHLQAQRQVYAPQYHYVVGLSRCFPIYWGHRAPAKLVVENCQARQSKEASAASDLFGWHLPSPPIPKAVMPASVTAPDKTVKFQIVMSGLPDRDVQLEGRGREIHHIEC